VFNREEGNVQAYSLHITFFSVFLLLPEAVAGERGKEGMGNYGSTQTEY
jgi:hypothetical protein